jgi:acetylornithine deacetylase/succinyl-diaminopimelate desuccinylase-like protein
VRDPYERAGGVAFADEPAPEQARGGIVGDEELSAAVAAMMPQVRGDLERLVRIPSVAFEGFPAEPVLEAAEATRALFAAVGVPNARLRELPEGHPPAVVGEVPAPSGAPTVLLYAHYDVQPAGEGSAWSSPPFEPVEREGRLYGRGTADDKSGIVAHAAAIRAFGGDPPVGVKVLIEGEEETGGSALDRLIPAEPEPSRADAVLVADMGNVELAMPTLTTSLRGVTSVVVEVRTLAGEVHSGLFGGAAPDALMALIRMLDGLVDDAGDTVVAGLAAGSWPGAQPDEETFRRLAGVEDGVSLVGTGPLGDRLWARPSVNVIGIDAPAVHGSRNALVDVARARISLRVPPAQDPVRAQDALARHLQERAPWGSEVSVHRMETGPGIRVRADGPAYAAMRAAMGATFGAEPVEAGSGGSIPLIDTLARTYPRAEILMLGTEEPSSNIHAADESVDLAELERIALSETRFLAGLGGA